MRGDEQEAEPIDWAALERAERRMELLSGLVFVALVVGWVWS